MRITHYPLRVLRPLINWYSGNGWAAMGMMRVLATIHASSAVHDLDAEQDDLVNWVDEILAGAFRYQVSSIMIVTQCPRAQ